MLEHKWSQKEQEKKMVPVQQMESTATMYQSTDTSQMLLTHQFGVLFYNKSTSHCELSLKVQSFQQKKQLLLILPHGQNRLLRALIRLRPQKTFLSERESKLCKDHTEKEVDLPGT